MELRMAWFSLFSKKQVGGISFVKIFKKHLRKLKLYSYFHCTTCSWHEVNSLNEIIHFLIWELVKFHFGLLTTHKTINNFTTYTKYQKQRRISRVTCPKNNLEIYYSIIHLILQNKLWICRFMDSTRYSTLDDGKGSVEVSKIFLNLLGM